MKIRLSPLEIYEVTIPEEISLIEFRGMLQRLNKIFKAFPDAELNAQVKPIVLTKTKLKRFRIPHDKNPLLKDRALALGYIQAYKNPKNNIPKYESAERYLKAYNIAQFYNLSYQTATWTLAKNLQRHFNFTDEEINNP